MDRRLVLLVALGLLAPKSNCSAAEWSDAGIAEWERTVTEQQISLLNALPIEAPANPDRFTLPEPLPIGEINALYLRRHLALTLGTERRGHSIAILTSEIQEANAGPGGANASGRYKTIIIDGKDCASVDGAAGKLQKLLHEFEIRGVIHLKRRSPVNFDGENILIGALGKTPNASYEPTALQMSVAVGSQYGTWLNQTIQSMRSCKESVHSR